MPKFQQVLILIFLKHSPPLQSNFSGLDPFHVIFLLLSFPFVYTANYSKILEIGELRFHEAEQGAPLCTNYEGQKSRDRPCLPSIIYFFFLI